MERRAPVTRVPGNGLPGLALEEPARRDRVVHEGGALGEDLAGPHRVVSDLGVAHVTVARHADGRTVGVEQRVRMVAPQAVEDGRVRRADRVALLPLAVAHAVEHDGEHGTGNASERRVRFELRHGSAPIPESPAPVGP